MSEDDYLSLLKELWVRRWPETVPRQASYPFGEQPLTEYLRARAKRHPDKAVLVFYGRHVSFAELDELSDRLASLLARRGVRAGDRVAVFLPNCPQFLVAFYAILKLGAVHVPVNPLFKSQEVLYQLRDSGARVIVALDQLYDTLRSIRAEADITHVLVTGFADMLPPSPTLPLPPALALPRVPCEGAEDLMPALARVQTLADLPAPDLDALAALNYTGGTTGLPKGCMHTQRNMLYTAANVADVMIGLTPDDVTLGINPAFWIAGENALVIMPVFSGTTAVMLARWDPVAFMMAVERYKVTSTTLVLDSAVEVLEHPEVANFQLRSLRDTRISSFVKKLNIPYRERWHALTGTLLRETSWGMTETHTSDCFTRGQQEGDFDLRSRPIYVGLPMPGTEFKITSFDTGELLPLGAEGELCCRTPSLFKGYWQRPDATADCVRDGWLHTGDIALLDEDGYLHFLGRNKEMLKVKGMPVFPAEVEALLGMHPLIVGSGVLGRVDQERGEVPVAFIELQPVEPEARPTEAQLQAWCRERMASYKVPEFRIVEALPRSATGKVLKRELAKLLD
jgi:acyl-CoA synthetase (AMP-forming)/AMP-acid ligase II